jgi:hypothetical protein
MGLLWRVTACAGCQSFYILVYWIECGVPLHIVGRLGESVGHLL